MRLSVLTGGLARLSTKIKEQCTGFLSFLFCAAVCFFPPVAHAGPEGANIVAGEITIEEVDKTTTIRQRTGRGVINWHTFDVAKDEAVHFDQPGTSSITLNRVTGGQGASSIFGQLTATGQVWILNPQGVYFGRDAYVDVAGVLASTYEISNADFLSGKYHFVPFPGDADGFVRNGGTTIASGLVALLSHEVENVGLIHAHLGQIILGSNPEWTLDFYGDNLIHMTVDESLLEKTASVNNSGSLIANGGYVFLTVDQAKDVIDNVINVSGNIQANTVEMQNGEIILVAKEFGNVNISGTISAMGDQDGQTGGRIHILGREIVLFDYAHIDASGVGQGGEILLGGDYQGIGLELTAENTYVGMDVALHADSAEGDAGRIVVWADGYTVFHGEAYARALGEVGNGGFIETSGKFALDIGENVFVSTASANGDFGMWLLDPEDIVVDDALAGVYNATLASNNLTILADNDITFSNTTAITLSSGTNFYVKAGDEIAFTTLGVAINASHDESEVYLIADYNSDGVGTLSFAGTGNVTATGGASVYGYYNPAGGYTSPDDLMFNLGVVTTITGDAEEVFYMLIHSVEDLQNMEDNLTGDYALSRNIDASATRDWNAGAGFNPVGDDVNPNINTDPFRGDFDGRGYTIDRLYIYRPSEARVGLFGAALSSTIKNVGLTNVQIWGSTYSGSLIGRIRATSSDRGLVENVYSTGTATLGNHSGHLIGEVGVIDGAANASLHGYTTVRYAWSDGSVSGGANTGGLLGRLQSGSNILEHSYSNADVTATNNQVGGLVGLLRDSGGGVNIVRYSYATGDVTASSSNDVGGLVGEVRDNNQILNSFVTGNVTGYQHVGGLVGTTESSSSIENSYATGMVSGTYYVGGLLGFQSSGTTLTKSYYTGTGVTGSYSGYLAGYRAGTLSASFFDNQGGDLNDAHSVGIGADLSGSAKSTAEMQSSTIYTNAGWDFDNSATSVDGDWIMLGGYPFIQRFNSEKIINVYQLQAMAANLDGNYEIIGDIDARDTAIWNNFLGFSPVGNNSAVFTGTLDGLDHVVRGLTIHRGGDYIGLFGKTNNATIRNVGLTDVDIEHTGSAIGGLIGWMENGLVDNSFAHGEILRNNDLDSGTDWGLLIGRLDGGSGEVHRSHSFGVIEGRRNRTGGLIGSIYNDGAQGGTLTESYSTADVYGLNTNVGGLVGLSGGTIRDSFATGIVHSSSTGSIANIGGLVGSNYRHGLVENSFAIGGVSQEGTSPDVGSLVGEHASNATGIKNSFALASTLNIVGTLAGPNYENVTNITTEQMQMQSTFEDAGWDFEDTWFILDKPHLQSDYTTRISNVFQLQMMNQALAANYELVDNIDASDTASWNCTASCSTPGSEVFAGFKQVGFDTLAGNNVVNGATFSGTFDGQYHVIDGLTINRPAEENIGLFGQTLGAVTIENIGLTNVDFTGDTFVGGIVGNFHDGTAAVASISNVFVIGVLYANDIAGGIVGIMGHNQTIDRAYTAGTITANLNLAAGIAGYIRGASTITDSYSLSTINAGTGEAGGVVAQTQGAAMVV